MPCSISAEHRTTLEVLATRDHLVGTGSIFRLEQRLKEHYGKEFCVVTSSATSALLATGIALGLRGSEVLTSPLAWAGAIGSLSILGNSFTLGSVDAASLNLDPASIRDALGPVTKAILATDQFGTAHDQLSIRQEADRHGLLYISDAASSLGAYSDDGKPASSLADVLVVSFGDKAITAGEGGAVLTDDCTIYEALVHTCQHAQRQRKEFGVHSAFAPLNARLHPLASDLLLSTWDYQMEGLRARQHNMHVRIMADPSMVNVTPFPRPESSTYYNLLLHVRECATVPHEKLRPLSFIHDQVSSSGSPPVEFRVADRVGRQLDLLRAERYVRATDLNPDVWRSC